MLLSIEQQFDDTCGQTAATQWLACCRFGGLDDQATDEFPYVRLLSAQQCPLAYRSW